MKKIVMLGLVALMSVCAMAQNNGGRMDRSKMIKQHAEQLSKDFELKGDAKTAFEALYTEYATALHGEPAQRHEQAGERGNHRREKLTDEQAKERISQHFEHQEKQIADQQRRLEVQRQYADKFLETLTPQQVLRVLQGGQMNRMGQRPGQGNRMGGDRGPRGGMGGGFGGQHGGFDEGF